MTQTQAKVALPTDHDMTAIVAGAGGQLENCLYEDGMLIVSGIDQAALDAAVAAYDHAAAIRAIQWAAIRRERDRLLAESQWLIDRHRDQMDAGVPTTLTAAALTGVLAWRQALRDLPATYANSAPAAVVFPACPVSTQGI